MKHAQTQQGVGTPAHGKKSPTRAGAGRRAATMDRDATAERQRSSAPAQSERSEQATEGRPAGVGQGAGRYVGDRYRLEELIGVGGTAQVWRAVALERGPEAGDGRLPDGGIESGHEGPQFGQAGGTEAGGTEAGADEVAVKLLHPYLVPDGISRVRLLSEARAVRSLHHPAIVGLRDVVVNDDEVALVFDYVAGGSLAARLRAGGRLEPRRAAEIAAQLADALGYAHGRGVVHLDVTPGNILMDAGDRPRLADFGIARLLEESAATATMTGAVTGTLRYMSPEQLAGRSIDPRADIYSLGVVLYEMLAGAPLYDAKTPVALAAQQVAPPNPLPPTVPKPLADLVRACIQPRAVDRPRTSEAIAAYLRDWLANGRVGTRRLSPGAPSPDAHEAATPSALGSATADSTSAGGPARGVVTTRWAAGREQLGGGVQSRRPETDRRLAFGLLATGVIVAGAFLATLAGTPGSRAAAPPAPTSRVSATPSATPHPTVRPTPTAAPVTPAPVQPQPIAPPAAGHHKKHRGRRRSRRG